MNKKNNDSNNVYFGGIPYGPDVQKLRNELGVPERGTQITHEEFEKIIGIKRANPRYRRVIQVWRKQLFKENNVDTEWERGVGLNILKEPERIGASSRDLNRAARQAQKSHIRATHIKTEELNDTDRRKADHLRTVSAMVYGAASKGAQEVSKTLSQPLQLPKPPETKE